MRQEHVDYLDGWRGLAVTALLLGHFFPYWRLALGLLGVNLFFVLSGLLMARLLFVKKTPIALFYKRRIARIFPALYVFIVCLLLAYSLAGLPISASEALGALALVRNYYPVGFGNAVPFDHIWSLSVEEHAYVALSFIAVLSRAQVIGARLAVGFFVAAAVGMAGWYSLTYTGADVHADRLIHSEVSIYGIFCSAFLVLASTGRRTQTPPAFVFPAVALLALLMHYFSLPRFFTLVLGVGALAWLINHLAQAPSWMRQALSWQPLRQLGLWSYSIYLWQQPFYVLKDKHVLSTPVAFVCAIAAGLLSYYLIEKPARAYLNRNWASAPLAPAPQA